MTHAPILVLILSACAPMADPPRLMPTDQILAEPALPAHATDASADSAPVQQGAAGRADTLRGRADALRARADALRGPVVEPDLVRRSRQ